MSRSRSVTPRESRKTMLPGLDLVCRADRKSSRYRWGQRPSLRSADRRAGEQDLAPFRLERQLIRSDHAQGRGGPIAGVGGAARQNGFRLLGAVLTLTVHPRRA
jgi:hypothetical protein